MTMKNFFSMKMFSDASLRLAAFAVVTLPVSSYSIASQKARFFRICPELTQGSACGSSNDFVIALSRRDQIKVAEDILHGLILDRVHVQGMIVAKRVRYNSPWRFHLKSSTVSFFTFGNISCWDYSTSDINSNLEKIGTASFLPLRYWCPRGYRLSEEVR